MKKVGKLKEIKMIWRIDVGFPGFSSIKGFELTGGGSEGTGWWNFKDPQTDSFTAFTCLREF